MLVNPDSHEVVYWISFESAAGALTLVICRSSAAGCVEKAVHDMNLWFAD